MFLVGSPVGRGFLARRMAITRLDRNREAGTRMGDFGGRWWLTLGLLQKKIVAFGNIVYFLVGRREVSGDGFRRNVTEIEGVRFL